MLQLIELFKLKMKTIRKNTHTILIKFILEIKRWSQRTSTVREEAFLLRTANLSEIPYGPPK